MIANVGDPPAPISDRRDFLASSTCFRNDELFERLVEQSR